MANSRIPSTIAAFDKYINSTADDVASIVVPIVQDRFGWTLAEGDAWTSARKDWRDSLYKKYSDENQCTSVVKKNVKKFMKDFHTTNNNLLDRAAASPGSTSADEALYHFIKEHAAPKHRKEPIEDKIFPLQEAKGGGIVSNRCRTASDAKRAHLAEFSDSVQVASAVGRVLANENDNAEKTIYTKAKFNIETGSGNNGKNLSTFMRWYNTKNPKLSAPWCGPFSSDIL